MIEEKRFDEWIDLKKTIHDNAFSPRIREGEVWWCAFGENVGVEINGKKATFSRPVVIMKKLSQFGFMGIPLTSQEKTGLWYVKFQFLGKDEYAALCQARVMSISRLYNKIGMLPESDLQKIREGFRRLY